MGRIYKIGKTWYIDVSYKGKRARKAIGTSKKLALSVLKELEDRIKVQRYFDVLDEIKEVIKEQEEVKLNDKVNFNKVAKEIQSIREVKIFNDFFKIQSDNVLIFSDVHLPFTDFEFSTNMFKVAKKFESKDCIIAGDFFDEGIFSDYLHYEKVLWIEEKEMARKFLEYLVNNFKRVYILCGNHDNRILRKLEFNETYSEIFKTIYQAKNLFITDYPFLELSGNWLVVHPKSYSQISGQVAKKLAVKYQKNVISTHGHFTSLGFDISGNYYAIDIGGLVDLNKIEYLHHNITTHPRWVKSFVIIKNNHPFLFTEKDNYNLITSQI